MTLCPARPSSTMSSSLELQTYVQTTYCTHSITHGCLFPEMISGKGECAHKCLKKKHCEIDLCYHRYPHFVGFRLYIEHFINTVQNQEMIRILFTAPGSRPINWVQTVYNIENAPLYSFIETRSDRYFHDPCTVYHNVIVIVYTSTTRNRYGTCAYG